MASPSWIKDQTTKQLLARKAKLEEWTPTTHGVRGTLTVGGNGTLPQGEPIVFDVALSKAD